MAIDAATRDSLELTRSVRGASEGSLMGEIDRCQTATGRRLLFEDISAPLELNIARSKTDCRSSRGFTQTPFGANKSDLS